MPSPCSAAIASGVDALIGSATPSSPAARPSTATNITVCPCARSSAAAAASSPTATPSAVQQRRVAERRPRARRPCRARPCRCRSESPLPARPPARAPARRATIAAASGCSLRVSRLAARRSTSSSSNPGAATTRTSRGLPSVSVPVLSTTSVSTCSSSLERLGVLDQHARLRAAPGADHDRHRRRQAERARTGDDQHGDRVDERVRQARLGAEQPPDDEGERRRRRSPPARSRPRPRRRAAGSARGCAAPRRPCCTICASSVSRPTRSARMTKLPVPLTVPPVTRSPGRFSTGIGSPVTIDSSTDAAALDDHAVDRHLLARPDAQPVARLHAARAARPPRVPSSRSRRAVFGASPSSARMALPVRLRARSSSTCPSSTSAVITAAASK